MILKRQKLTFFTFPMVNQRTDNHLNFDRFVALYRFINCKISHDCGKIN